MEYSEAPTYIVHKELDEEATAGIFMDTAGNSYEVVADADGIRLGGTYYYNQEKVDSLLEELTTTLTEAATSAIESAISASETEIKEWAAGEFEPLAEDGEDG